jgi:hypothetical protein
MANRVSVYSCDLMYSFSFCISTLDAWFYLLDSLVLDGPCEAWLVDKFLLDYLIILDFALVWLPVSLLSTVLFVRLKSLDSPCSLFLTLLFYRPPIEFLSAKTNSADEYCFMAGTMDNSAKYLACYLYFLKISTKAVRSLLFLLRSTFFNACMILLRWKRFCS